MLNVAIRERKYILHYIHDVLVYFCKIIEPKSLWLTHRDLCFCDESFSNTDTTSSTCLEFLWLEESEIIDSTHSDLFEVRKEWGIKLVITIKICVEISKPLANTGTFASR
jgi:hypothetical protein